MNQPTVEQFLGTPYSPEEDDDEVQMADLQKIAEGVQQIVEILSKGQAQASRSLYEAVSAGAVAGSGKSEEPEPVQDWSWDAEAMSDLEAKYEVALQVIADVEEALGKSTAKPALAARAVIEAWRNPQLPDEAEPTIAEEPAGGLQDEDDATWESEAREAIRAEQNELTAPEHTAPVEEWRNYARALGYAGPEIDNANRSQIRTALGLSQEAGS